MEVEYAFLADAAQVTDGKLYVLGGNFDRIFARQFPATHPAMSLALSLKVYPTEYGRQNKLEIQLWDSDGKRLTELQGDFSLTAPADDPARPSVTPFVFNLLGQLFPHPGRYAFYIVVNGEQKKEVPLDLVKVP